MLTSELITNHIVKHIVLEAPTIPELEKKVKTFKFLLISATTNSYKITELSLEQGVSYYYSCEAKSYQTSIFFSFAGKRKDIDLIPEVPLENLRQINGLISKEKTVPHIIEPSLILKEFSNVDTFSIEADSTAEIDEAISHKQREFMLDLISNINLTNISFFTKSKTRNASTGKIKLEMSVKYTAKERCKKQRKNPIER